MRSRPEIPPGTLYMLILKSIARLGPMHGYGIAQHIQQTSDDVLQVEEGSLYPALQRMLLKGWVAAEWKQSENNRRARYYRLTPRGPPADDARGGRVRTCHGRDCARHRAGLNLCGNCCAASAFSSIAPEFERELGGGDAPSPGAARRRRAPAAPPRAASSATSLCSRRKAAPCGPSPFSNNSRRTCAMRCAPWRPTRSSPPPPCVSLALGIGANTAIYSFMDAILLRALPVPHPEQLAVADWHAPRRIAGGEGHQRHHAPLWQGRLSQPQFSVSPPGRLLRADKQVFSTLFAYTYAQNFNVITGGAGRIDPPADSFPATISAA